jgi:F-type H+-transporting ATPase subunit a
MEELGKLHQLIIPFFGYRLAFNLEVIVMTWIVMAIIILFGYLATRKRSTIPGSFQIFGELFALKLYELCEDALGAKMAKTYAPLITTLFLFLLLCNWIGIIPHMEEPTKDLNTTLSLGVLGFVVAHYVGIKSKGLKAYLKEYCEPMFFMAPLNVISELAKIVSISFRLFGNIMGGAIIILVVSYLCYNVLLPPFLYAFFGLFVGAIQAFVFTMLTVVYIAVQAK